MQNMLEDYYLPVRGGQSGTEIDDTESLATSLINNFPHQQLPSSAIDDTESLGS